MRRAPRIVALVLLALGVIGAVIAMIWILVARQTIPRDEAVSLMAPLRRAIAAIVHSRYAVPLAGVFGASALGAAILLWFGFRRRRWALALIAAGAICAIAAVWGAHRVVKKLEDPQYAKHSVYVRAATQLSIAGTVYFGLLAACAGAAWAIARKEPAAAAVAVSSPSPAP